ncbi:MAG: hypothetical protein R3Y36_04695 [Spirochaetales bacterium]
MPWKLVLFLLCLVAATFFIGFNLENTCTISFGFTTFENVPVFFTVFISFMLGSIVILPFMIRPRRPQAKKSEVAEKIPTEKKTPNVLSRIKSKQKIKHGEGQDTASAIQKTAESTTVTASAEAKKD